MKAVRITLNFTTRLVAIVFCYGVTRVAAQGIPTEFTNLQILPERITRDEIVPIMRNFASSLGVRCAYCHTVSVQLDQPEDDFASDDKVNKLKARMMMEMVMRINDETIAQLPERDSPLGTVTCMTCHGGLERPVPIDDQIRHGIETEGIDAAVASYRQLRDQYYGSRAYDFGFAALNNLAQQLIAGRQAAEAVQLLQLNSEYHPTSLPTLILLGQAHESNDDSESAARVYRGLVNIDPATPFYDFYAGQARQRLEEIGVGQ